MALLAIQLRKKIDIKRKALDDLAGKDADFEKREAELETAINEAVTDEDQADVESAINEFEAERTDHSEMKASLEKELADLEEQLRSIESIDSEVAQAPEVKPEPAIIERKDNITMDNRSIFRNMNEQDRTAMMARDDVKGWISEIREHISQKRELTNVGLTIPEVFLGYLRENITKYSKLYKHVNVQRISGNGREVVMGSVPEGIWTECCAVLNELSLSFSDVEVSCYKIGGFIKVCNAILEDSDINLASTILDAIGQAIGFGLDKAILYGRNTATNYKMPLGVVSRLAQTEQPSDYSSTARTWVDLHTSNIQTISDASTGVNLFKQILLAAGNMKNNYARGEKVWVMNETTYTALKVEAMSVNANGAIVSGFEGTMPVIGGIVEVLDFIPNNVIIGGYFELYLLAERAGSKFAQSEHAFFIQDQTVFKATARYDGAPVISEGFVAIGIGGTTPTASMSFAPDNANTVQNILLNKSTATVAVDGTLQLTATTLPVEGTVTWASSDSTKATVSTSGLVTGKAAGSAVITATCGSVNATATITVSAGA